MNIDGVHIDTSMLIGLGAMMLTVVAAAISASVAEHYLHPDSYAEFK